MPYKSKAEQREYDRNRNKGDLPNTRRSSNEHRSRYKRAIGQSTTLPFAGTDGEGGDDIHGRHHYYLLRAGAYLLETGLPLSWRECLDFLCDLPKDVCYISYYFGYDVTKIVEGLSGERIARLHNREGRRHRPKNGQRSSSYWPVDINEKYEVDYVKGKEFKCRRIGERWTIINDVSSFFQCSFYAALCKWDIGTEEQRAAILASKMQRSNFGKVTQEIRDYNELECDLLVQMMNKFRASCKALGYIPRFWQGPGNLAVAMMSANKVPKRRELEVTHNEDLMRFGTGAFYGGRFETSTVGPVPGPVYNADINSAYPFALTKMPCFRCGQWWKSVLPESGTYIAHGSFSPKSFDVPPTFYGFPIRSKLGSISWPGGGVGYYWSMEVEQAIHQNFHYQSTWNYRRRCECADFSYIPKLYDARRKMGKDARGETVKLGLNSHAGKHMQSIGTAPYANPLAASFITSFTRAQMGAYIHSLPGCKFNKCGEEVHMLATDGIFTTALPVGQTFSKDLGAWDLKALPDGMFIVQPGFYYGADKSRPKSRGMNLNKAIEYEQAFRDAYFDMVANGPSAGNVTIPVHQFIGIGQALMIGLQHLGQWEDKDRKISFDWTAKRQLRPFFDELRRFRTVPYDGAEDIETVAYSKDIGRVYEEMEQWRVTEGADISCDWEERLLTEDSDFFGK